MPNPYQWVNYQVDTFYCRRDGLRHFLLGKSRIQNIVIEGPLDGQQFLNSTRGFLKSWLPHLRNVAVVAMFFMGRRHYHPRLLGQGWWCRTWFPVFESLHGPQLAKPAPFRLRVIFLEKTEKEDGTKQEGVVTIAESNRDNCLTEYRAKFGAWPRQRS